MTALAGKHVLLTGGSRGIGPVIAAALAERGAHLALVARSADGLQTVVKSLAKYGVKTLAIPEDLTQTAQLHTLITTVIHKFGTLDILINNAGVETEGAYVDLTWEAIQENIVINLLAPMALTHLALPHMLERKQGHIVNIASVAAKCGNAYAAPYCGAKAGLAEWTRALRLELEGSGVHFSTIFPGYVTEIGMFARFHKTPPASIGSCTPAQVAGAVVRAIEREEVEVIVNSTPARLFFTLFEISPKLGDWLMHKWGFVDFQRQKLGK